MTVMVPTDNAGRAGLRRVIDEATVKKVLAVLQDACSDMPKNWNRRFKHNRDKIKTGDIYELAEVVRNLAIREAEKGLSTGEKQMFTRAKKVLASELMYALDLDEEPASVRGAVHVRRPGIRVEEGAPAGLPEAVGPVDLFAEEEEALVGRTDLVDRGAADEPHGAHQDLRLAHLVVGEAGRVEGVQRAGAGSERAQEEVLGREPPERREPAHRPLQRAVRVAEARPDDRRVGMRVGERHERVEGSGVQPGVRVEQEHVAPARPLDAGVPACREPAVLLLDDGDLGEALAHEGDCAVGRAVVDDDGLGAAHACERLLDPRQRVVRDAHDRDVAHLGTALRAPPLSASHAMIAAPGSAKATVTTKNRKPVANARSADTPSAPRNETKNDSRTASPFTVNGTSMTRKSSGPIT